MSCKIGFLGPPGHGKSTLINTLIEKAGILPADSSGDSCTAVPMTLGFNHDAANPFRAEIKYISGSVWEAVIKDGLAAATTAVETGETLDEDIPAIIKLKAVCPNLELESLHKYSVQDIADMNKAKSMLDKTQGIRSDNALSFKKAMEDKLIPKKTAYTLSSGRTTEWRSEMSIYPLIDSIQIYVRSKLLEDGLTLLDIPGLNDSNVVKSARAEEAMLSCDVLVITTDAGRASANSEAHQFIEMALKLLHHGNLLLRVVIANTKSDNFYAKEERPHLNDPCLDEVEAAIQEAQKNFEREESKLRSSEKDLKTMEIDAHDIHINLGRWTKARTRVRKGHILYEPEMKKSGKNVKPEPGQPPLDATRADEVHSRLKEEKRAADVICKEQKRNIDAQVTVLEQAKSEMTGLIATWSNHVFRLRNQINKARQKQIFIDKIKQRDLELAEIAQRYDLQNDTENAQIETRNYAELKEMLAVFCLSAVAFQEKLGLKTCQGTRDGIIGVEDTELPAFVQHLSKIGSCTRYEKLQSIDNDVQTALESLRLHANHDIRTQPVNIEAAKLATANALDTLRSFVLGLEQMLAQSFLIIHSKCAQSMKESGKIKERVIDQSVKELLEYRPGNPRFPSYASFRATMKRHGEWTTQSKTPINLNRLVKEAFDATISTMMSQLFHSQAHPCSSIRKLEECLFSFVSSFDSLTLELSAFAATAEANSCMMAKIDQQHQRRKQTLLRYFNKAKETISNSHLKAGLRLADDIQTAWASAYNFAYQDCSGRGATDAMIETLCVAITKGDVLDKSFKGFEDRLAKNIEQVKLELANEVKALMESLENDYKTAFHYRQEISLSSQDLALESIMKDLGLEFDGHDVVGVKTRGEQRGLESDSTHKKPKEELATEEMKEVVQGDTASDIDVYQEDDEVVKAEFSD